MTCTAQRLIVLLVAAVACGAAVGVNRLAPQPAPADGPADLVIVNGAVYAGDGGDLRQALAIRGNRIAIVGGNDDVERLRGPRTQVLDARGGAVVPGFNDIHTHTLSGGLDMDTVNLQGAQTLDEVQSRIRAYAAAHRDLAWIRGRGWGYGPFPGSAPTRAQLDAAVADRPAIMRCFDGHSIWANTRALAAAHITRATPDPPNGVIVRDPATGEPTGLLKESPAMALMNAVVPKPARAEQRHALEAALAEAIKYGVTDRRRHRRPRRARRLRSRHRLRHRLGFNAAALMFPFGGLPENLAAFCAFLRHEHRFAIDRRQLRDAARAIDVIDVTDGRAVRDALRPVLASTFRDAASFDGAFMQFFFPGPAGVPQTALLQPRRDVGGSANGADKELERDRADRERDRERPETSMPGALSADETPAETASARPTTVLGRYSPIDAEAQSRPQLTPADRAWQDAARVLVRRVQLGLSRRWRPAASGQRFDLRRTLRASLHTGGEPLVVRWLRRRKQSPRFVVIVDGSRSMADAAATAVYMTVAIASVSARVEAFTFSTGLQRITEQVRLAAAGQPLRLGRMQYAWGGGTAIGACLREFLRRFGDRLLGRETTVIIASDGLDVGDVVVLRDAMREIRRRSAAVVWLNPLLDSAGYQPTASGMMMARPYITTFASVCDPPALARLARTIRLQLP